jgi:putative transposase
MKKNATNEVGTEVGVLAQLVMPLAELVRGDLRAFVLSVGMRALTEMLETERTALAGPRYQHDPSRGASRGGTTRGKLTLGGRRVSVPRPRVVDRDGKEVPLASWQQLAARDPMDERVLEQMTLGVATRKYERSLESIPAELAASSTSKSSVSRRFVEVTKHKLGAWMSRSLAELSIAAIFIDGIHFAEHVVLVALGVDAKGTKHVLGLWEGATENGAACRAMLADLVTRGLDAKARRLFVIDGSGALRSAIRDTFGKRALVQRCQVHKMRNVEAHLPKSMHAAVRATMHQAYKTTKVETAKRQLENLARSLEDAHPSASNSLREGLDETLTVMGLALPQALERSFSTTNPIESLNDRLRTVARRVKRWRGGSMILRWTAAGVWEASRGFRRLKGHLAMPVLIAALANGDPARQSDATLDVHQEAA